TLTAARRAPLGTTPPYAALVRSPVTLAAIAEDSGARLITQAQLLANASDVDGPSLTASGLAIATGSGTLVDNGNGSWSYSPALNDDISVSFSYTVSDGSLTAAGSATLDITPVNDAPVISGSGSLGSVAAGGPGAGTLVSDIIGGPGIIYADVDAGSAHGIAVT